MPRRGAHAPRAVKLLEGQPRGILALAHAKVVLEAWQREYNEEKPKRSLGGLTPAQYTKQLATRAVSKPDDSEAPHYSTWGTSTGRGIAQKVLSVFQIIRGFPQKTLAWPVRRGASC